MDGGLSVRHEHPFLVIGNGRVQRTTEPALDFWPIIKLPHCMMCSAINLLRINVTLHCANGLVGQVAKALRFSEYGAQTGMVLMGL